MEGASKTNKPEGSKSSDDRHQDKPASAIIKSGSDNTMWNKVPTLFLYATIVLLIACLYWLYATIQEVQKKQRSLEDRIDKLDEFVEEFDKTFTAADIRSDKHTIQQLHYSIEHIKANLRAVKDEVDERTAAIYDRIDNLEGCQSGTEIGEHTYPAQSFPLERTVKFDQPFKKVPAFSFGTTLLDSTSHLSVHVQLRSLTPESFTIYINTWGRKYALYGARISWMACPK